MRTSTKIATTLILLVLLVALGGLDYYFSGDRRMANLFTGDPSSMPIANAPSADSSSSVATLPPNAPAGAVMRASEVSVESVLTPLGFSLSDSKDQTLLGQIVGDRETVTTKNIVKGDRIGSVTWVDSPRVKMEFVALKDALLKSFTPKMKGLKDEVLREQGKPIRNVLSFTDPGLSPEAFTFVRIRERLYEFHIATGSEAAIATIIAALTAR